MSSNLSVKLWIGVICFAAMGLFMGCRTHSQCNKPDGQHADPSTTPVVSHDTLFYRTGPQQAMPPDGTFKAGTRIEIIQEAGSYTLVRAQDGREGYVSSDAITVPNNRP
jgi:uncharacterized protein YgiM (DUF1202 family)